MRIFTPESSILLVFNESILALADGNLPSCDLRDSSGLRFNRFLGTGGRFGDLVTEGDDGAVARIDIEILVQILKRTVCCLRVEEVNNRDEKNVECGED